MFLSGETALKLSLFRTRHLLLGRKPMTNLDSILKSRGITLPAKVCIVKSMVFPVVMYKMWELDHKVQALKNWYFQTLVLRRLESPLDSKEIQPVHPKGDQSWVFIGRTDAEAETPELWPPDAKSWLTGKDWTYWKRLLGKTEGRRGWQDETVGWHLRMWVCANWETVMKGKPGVLQFVGSQSDCDNWYGSFPICQKLLCHCSAVLKARLSSSWHKIAAWKPGNMTLQGVEWSQRQGEPPLLRGL